MPYPTSSITVRAGALTEELWHKIHWISKVLSLFVNNILQKQIKLLPIIIYKFAKKYGSIERMSNGNTNSL